MQPFYDWCGREARKLADALRRSAIAGDFSQAVYFVPAAPGEWARLVLAHEKPEAATDVIRWRVHGVGLTDRICAVPYDAIASQLADSCRSMPVYPV